MSTKGIQKSTKEKVFKPSPKQQEYVLAAVEAMTDSPTKIAEKCGVSRSAWYKWLREDPDFIAWFYEEYRNMRKRIIPRLDAIALKHAKRGDFDFWKAMNQKVGDFPADDPSAVQQVIVQVPEVFAEKYVEIVGEKVEVIEEKASEVEEKVTTRVKQAPPPEIEEKQTRQGLSRPPPSPRFREPPRPWHGTPDEKKFRNISTLENYSGIL